MATLRMVKGKGGKLHVEAGEVLEGKRRSAVCGGDFRDTVRHLPDNSIDAIVTDGPYELGFMGKSWDKTGIVYDRKAWAALLRVLKPGGILAAFGGTSKAHRVTCAIEDGGFEVFDTFNWIYGSGFPKSLDLGREVEMHVCALPGRHYDKNLPRLDKRREGDHLCPASSAGDPYRGRGTALKPAHEPIIMACKPFRETYAANVLRHGTSGLNIDAARIGEGEGGDRDGESSAARRYTEHGGTNFAMLPGPRGGDERGRWPANVILTHCIDCSEIECVPCCPVAELDRQSGGAGGHAPVRGTESSSPISSVYNQRQRMPGVFHGVAEGASTFFYCAKPSHAERDLGCEDLPLRSGGEATDREDDSKGLESPRAGAGRRGGVRNHHPTLKPLGLMHHLVQLVTPPGGIVLDPFAGSGTTIAAAMAGDWRGIACELTEEYLPIIRARVAAVAAGRWTPEQGILRRKEDENVLPGQLPLFEAKSG